MAARASSSSSDDVLSEESDSNALNLYDSDGNNSEPFSSLGHVPINMSRVGFPETIRTKTAQNRLTAMTIVSEIQIGI